jgi:magnesium transporter
LCDKETALLNTFLPQDGGLQKSAVTDTLPATALWIDMLHPTGEEEHLVEQALGLDLPTREEMQEIEISSRLYREDGGLFMTATVLSRTETERPEAHPVTFVLTGERLVTIRYSEPRTFQAFAQRAQRRHSGYDAALPILVGLLEAVVDRAADILERLGADVDAISLEIFEHRGEQPTKARNFHDMLRRIGSKGDLNSKARESLVSIGRLAAFLAQGLDSAKADREAKSRVKTLGRDVHSLTDHASFLSTKINFLLDATLGMINIEQNAIIKTFSVAAVAFLPPTLIASIYGMNFAFMPELKWPFGYLFAVVLMVLSAVLPYLYFKRRGWL